MQDLVTEYINMNQAGLVLELCEKFYDENVLMLNNGCVFAQSMRESYNKQQGFVKLVKEFDVKLISKLIKGNIVELIFSYKMINFDAKITEFKGKHIQTWQNNKIIKEEYISVNE
ncbi:hypothetical protein [Pseudoalteromonas denitrificans]|jgi:hypothetical protein|uniref:SnoaL-like domain-containing protein n=1 Tax=Pseudoalteromonas denitrificans DSM 6059 TaxID=1123010 RepID=A0A1I1NIV6_9GAMM|nr:hypothetical protein [Pseudoalteromonas denitrificans]SFC94663.1 hypothetical protein SAMN02745724_03008 [Pseudoalteromonas denitrificans DSM 6059]